MLDAAGLMAKHRGKGVLVDANLLVLFLVGLVNKKRIATFKRTQNLGTDDFDLLQKLLAHLGPPLIATPHLLSQVSDLAELDGNEGRQIRDVLKLLIKTLKEHHDPAKSIVDHAIFQRLGLADAGITLAGSTSVLILTADAQLHNAIQSRNIESLNFNHVRPLNWR